ncbi:MAG: tRNA preQ1(34) S-adenosylmethionine ribosyltransferase-isomerase QueA [Gemmatimonadetes bacterium]|nr:tRNA preQ1(34) S-adenosylmethionine ribosyltransferase-isomerase QueA [Gemmatimonadota bacterium]
MTPHAPGTRTADYDFALPPGRIAQEAAEPRDASRLMVVHRASGRIEHRVFRDIVEYLAPGDALVLNTTRVLRARLLGMRDSGAPAEVLLLRPNGDGWWEAMVHPGAKLKPGRLVTVAELLQVEIGARTERGTRLVRLVTELPEQDAIAAFGHVPLPPYITRRDTDADAARYQTVYAREMGSVAAPTAGLHFTPELLARIEASGVRRAEVVLHVGAGTFKPVEADDLSRHAMHGEWYELGEETARLLEETRARGGAVCAVGTTTVRTLESCWADGRYRAGTGETAIFLHPPRLPRAVDRMVTNFHLPRSTLIMLVAAFAGYELTMHAYREAIAGGYRFYSYGDAMLVR